MSCRPRGGFFGVRRSPVKTFRSAEVFNIQIWDGKTMNHFGSSKQLENTKRYQFFLDTFLSKNWTSAAPSKNSIRVSSVLLESKQNSQLAGGNLSPSFEGRMYCYFGINQSLVHRICYNSACNGAVAF